MSDSFRFAQIVCWVLPATVAGWNWGLAIALLTFGSQMFAAPPLTRMYAMWRSRSGDVEVEDVQRFNLVANVVAGTAFALLARAIVGDAAA
ncbi:MAG: hypothetical protein ACK4QW_00840 [Alphaproteobacteria bacterium]